MCLQNFICQSPNQSNQGSDAALPFFLLLSFKLKKIRQENKNTLIPGGVEPGTSHSLSEYDTTVLQSLMEAYCNIFEAIRNCDIFFILSMHDGIGERSFDL